jgi:hypothetical protein
LQKKTNNLGMMATASFEGQMKDGLPHGLKAVPACSTTPTSSLCSTGQGRCKFANTFFTFDGVFVDGVRRQGRLGLGDGSFYEGQFDTQGEITGAGYRKWPDGSSCVFICMVLRLRLLCWLTVCCLTGIRASLCLASGTALLGALLAMVLRSTHHACIRGS